MIVDSVSTYQYGQYADRDVRKKGYPRQTQPLKKINPLQNPPQFRLARKERPVGRNLRVQRIAVEKVKERRLEAIKKICQELTGKGVHIDVTI